MKRYRQLVTELPAKKVVFAFGRFQPPTNGHALLVNAVIKLAKAQKADHVIYASRSQDKKLNPLPVDRKVYYLKRMFPRVNFVAANDEIRTFMEVAKALSKKYKNLVMVAGSDRVPEYKKLLDKYNGEAFNFDTIEVISAGERDPDSDTAAGMSGTKMREAAKKGDFASFKKGLPLTITELDGKRLMNEIREGMGLDSVKESVQFERDEVREAFHSGSIYNVGDIVKVEESICTIVKRGSNYVLVQHPNGELKNKWLNELSECTEQEVKDHQEKLNEMKYTASDRLKVARVIATSLGHDAESSTNPELLVNTALRKVKNKALSKSSYDILQNMLKLAKDVNIKYDSKIVPKLKPVAEAAKVEIDAIQSDEEKDEDDLSDEEIQRMIDELEDDDFLHAYDDDELAIIDDETGEEVDSLKEEVEQLDEVLSRAERIRARMRFARTKAKRERRLKIALKTRSSSTKVNQRARRMAIKVLKTRLARKPVSQMSVAEKERVERILQKRKTAINRIAMRMVPKIRKIETTRLSHKSYTK